MLSRFIHKESHFQGSDTVRDVVIGMADGLTVPFALAAGISGATHTTELIVIAGLAEIAAGSTAMGLGGYLAAKSDEEHYASEQQREDREIDEKPEAEKEEVRVILQDFGLERAEADRVVERLATDRTAWRDFMMRFELDLEKPDPRRAVISAATIAGSYIVGGLIPLAPYILINEVSEALPISVVLTLIALFIFGYVKAAFTGVSKLKSGLQTTLVGGLAAGVAFGLARLIQAIGVV